MSISSSAIGIGLSGLQNFQRAIDVSANAIATAPVAAAAGTETPNLALELVNMMIYKAGFQASAQVVSVSNSLLGTLLDTHS